MFALRRSISGVTKYLLHKHTLLVCGDNPNIVNAQNENKVTICALDGIIQSQIEVACSMVFEVRDDILFCQGEVPHTKGIFLDLTTLQSNELERGVSLRNIVLRDNYLYCKQVSQSKDFGTYNLETKEFNRKPIPILPLFISGSDGVYGAGWVLLSFNLETGKVNWQIDLSDFEDEVSDWKIKEEKNKNIVVHGNIVRWKDSLILSIGPTFEQRLACFSIIDGKLNWIAKEYNSQGVFHIYKNNAYILYSDSNGLLVVDLDNGRSQVLDISEQNSVHAIEPGSNFSMNGKYIACAEYQKLILGLFNVDTFQYDFVHQFTRGKDIDKKVYQIEVPRYHDDRIYIRDSEANLHIFEREA